MDKLFKINKKGVLIFSPKKLGTLTFTGKMPIKIPPNVNPKRVV